VRDAALMSGGMERLHTMSDSDRQHLEGAHPQRYIAEFSVNGIANLEVVERRGAVREIPARTSTDRVVPAGTMAAAALR